MDSPAHSWAGGEAPSRYAFRVARPADYDAMRADGRTEVHAVTSPVNVASIEFHRAMGFRVSAPIADYDGARADRVVFTRQLDRR